MIESGKDDAMRTPAPRLLVGAPASGGGKTTFTCGLMHALKRRGLEVAACKCGPDYIDPMFHEQVIGAYSRNLDLFFSGERQVRQLVADSASRCDVTVIEGVMGYYDGIAVSDEASAWDVARATESPAVLVIDGRGRARSIAAEVKGFATFREDSRVRGVVLNRVSAGLYPRLKAIVEQETGVPVFGYVPVLDDCSLESRHLGLVTAAEVTDLRAKLDRLADVMQETVDIDGLLELAATAPALVIVGVMMMGPVVKIDWEDYSESIPAFITILLMPVAYSISDGILLGVIAYVLLNAVSGKFKKISVTMWILAVLFVLKYIFI